MSLVEPSEHLAEGQTSSPLNLSIKRNPTAVPVFLLGSIRFQCLNYRNEAMVLGAKLPVMKSAAVGVTAIFAIMIVRATVEFRALQEIDWVLI